MVRRNFRGKNVVITGAARGLGKALCERFGRAGARVGGIDILADELAATREALRAAGVTMETAVCDLADEQATTAAFRQLAGSLGPTEVLINNAGITHVQPFGAGESAAIRRVMEVNFLGAVHATAAAFDDLVAARGEIIVLSSVAGYAPLVRRTGYSASKHALHGFFGSLRAELHGTGVDVMLVCPSVIDTGIRDRSRDRVDRLPVVHAMDSPEAAAARIFSAAERGCRLLSIGRVGKLAFWLHRFAPRLYEAVMRRTFRDA